MNEEEKDFKDPAPVPHGKGKGKFDDRFAEAFFYWMSNGRSYTKLAKSRFGGSTSANTWLSRAKSNRWEEEAAFLDHQKFCRIQKTLSDATEERAKYLTEVALRALDNAIILNKMGEVVDVSFQVESVSDLDKLSRLVLLLQGSADQRVAVSSFSDLVQKMGNQKNKDKED